MNFQIPPSGLFRYPKSGDSSATAFALTAGFKSAELAAPNEVFQLKGAQGLEIAMGATISADDNDAFDYRIWIVQYTYDAAENITGMNRECFGYGTATLSAASFIGGTAAAATGRMADSITFTSTSVGGSPEGPGAVIQTAYGVAAASYTPDSDIPAKLYIPHLGWADGVIIEFDSTTGAPLGMFALIGRK